MRIINALKAWPWYYWVLAALIPGGWAIAAYLKARNAAPSPMNLNADAASVRAKFGMDALIGQAKDQADALRSGLANDPLAQNLLGVAPGMILAGNPAEVAAKEEKRKAYQDEITATMGQLSRETAAYAFNHNGGQNPSEWGARQAQLGAQISELQAKIAAL